MPALVRNSFRGFICDLFLYRAFFELNGRGMDPNEACALALKIAAGVGEYFPMFACCEPKDMSAKVTVPQPERGTIWHIGWPVTFDDAPTAAFNY